MMAKWMEYLKYHSLFVKLFAVTVIVIITITITNAYTTLRMSERLFIETFSITNAKVLNQIKENFEAFNYTVVVATNNLQQNATVRSILTTNHSNAELMRAYYEMNYRMENVKRNFDPYDASILITSLNGFSYATDRSYWPLSDSDWRNHSITRQTLEEPRRILYHYYGAQFPGRDEDVPTIVASNAMMERISGRIYGTVYFAIKEEDFRRFYHNFTSPGNDVFLIDRTGKVVSSSQPDFIGTKNDDLLQYANDLSLGILDNLERNFMGEDHIILMEYLPLFDMYLVNTINREVVSDAVIDRKGIIMPAATITFLALTILFIISRRLTNSLANLVKQIGNTPKHNFDQPVSVNGSYETRQIGNAFNAMLDELNDYVVKLMESQKQQRNAELAALQQQINPHFLYNTLTSIKFMVQQGSKEDAAAIINSLISLLQNTIGNVNETVTVQQELENLKNYVFINQKRYGDRIKVNYFVAPDCIDHEIPKLILQPFVENAFFHAFIHKGEGYINIMIWQEKDQLVCEVMDNGDGMDLTEGMPFPEKKQKNQQFSGIGIQNVHQRIQMIYGDSYGVNMTSTLREGTKVKLTMPVTKK